MSETESARLAYLARSIESEANVSAIPDMVSARQTQSIRLRRIACELADLAAERLKEMAHG